MIAALAVLAAITFDANVGYGDPFAIDPSQASMDVGRDDTQGSNEWYEPLESFPLGVEWHVRIDGKYLVNTNTGKRVVIHHVAEISRPHTESAGVDTGGWGMTHKFNFITADLICTLVDTDFPCERILAWTCEPIGQAVPTPLGEGSYSWKVLIQTDGDPFTRWASVTIEPTAHREYPGSVLSPDGVGPVYLPKSYRLSGVALGMVHSAFNAYWSRLYFPSFGDDGTDRAWDGEDEWGSIYPSEIEFNPTNTSVELTGRFEPRYPESAYSDSAKPHLQYYPRVYPDSRRLFDAGNIASFIHALRVTGSWNHRIYPANPLGPPVGTKVAPFLYRPGGIVDGRRTVESDFFGSHIWWATSVIPPLLPQPFIEDWVEVFVMPSAADFKLVPDMAAWTSTPIFDDDGGSQTTATWPMNAFVVDSFLDGTGDSADGPVFHAEGPGVAQPPWRTVFEALEDDATHFISPHSGYYAESGVLSGELMIRTYLSDCSFAQFLTNTFPVSCRSRPDMDDSWKRYAAAAMNEDPLQRITPDRIATMNQALAVLDRTVHVPSMHIVCTNEVTDYELEADYAGDPVEWTLHWNGSEWVVIGDVETLEYGLSKDGGDEWGYTDRGLAEHHGICEGISEIWTSVSGNGPSVDELSGDVYLTEDAAEGVTPEGTTNEILYVTDGGWFLEVAMTDWPSATDLVYARAGRDPDSREDVKAWYQPWANISRSYTYEALLGSDTTRDECGAYVTLGQVQPNPLVCMYLQDLPECEAAVLDRVHVTSKDGRNASEGVEKEEFEWNVTSLLKGYSDRESLLDAVSGHADGFRRGGGGYPVSGKLWGFADMPYDPDQVVGPLPGSVTAVFHEAPVFPEQSCIFFPSVLPDQVTVYHGRYHYRFEVPYYVITNAVLEACYSNEMHEIEFWFTETLHEREDGTIDHYVVTNRYQPLPPYVDIIPFHGGPELHEDTTNLVFDHSSYFEYETFSEDPFSITQSVDTITTPVDGKYAYDASRVFVEVTTRRQVYIVDPDPVPVWDFTDEYNTVIDEQALPTGGIIDWLPRDAERGSADYVYRSGEAVSNWVETLMFEFPLSTLVANQGGNMIAMEYYFDFVTEEDVFTPVLFPIKVGEFASTPGKATAPEIEYTLPAETHKDGDFFYLDLFFRIITQTDWPWPTMSLDKGENQ